MSFESHENSAKAELTVPAAGAAVTQDQVIGRVPIAGKVTDVALVPEADLAANATNFRTFRVINKGQDGNGSTVVASFATDTPVTDNLSDFDERAIPLSVVAGADAVAVGDVLAVDETVAGSGVAHSGYRIAVQVVRGQ